MLLLEQENEVELLSKNEFKQYTFSKGYYDIEFFSDYYLEHWKIKDWKFIETPEFHCEIREALDRWEDINIIIARGHGKTTAILIRILHSLLYKRHDSILYIASASLGEEGVGKIRYELETNKLIIKDFGSIVPTTTENKIDKRLKKWRQKLLQLTNGTSLETITKWWSIRWKRPQKIILDDPQENKDVKNNKTVESFNYWFFSSLYNTLLPGWSICVLGTIIGNLCLVKHLRDEKCWPTIEYQACNENFENILWPQMWTKESLLERRDWKIVLDPRTNKLIKKKWIGTTMFNQEFRNIPISEADKVVKDYWIRYYVKWITDFEYIVLAIDPATKIKEKNDFTWITVMWVKWYNKYVIYSKSVKLTPRNLEKFIVMVNDKFQPNVIVKEDNIEVKLTEDLKARWLPIESVYTHKDKFTRLLWVAGMIEVWDVYFLQNVQENLIDQITNFPEVEHDDEMDSFIIAITKAQEYIEWWGSDWSVEVV